MRRRRFSREFNIEAVKLVRERGVSAAQAARDRDVHENVLRKWVKEFGQVLQRRSRRPAGEGELHGQRSELRRTAGLARSAGGGRHSGLHRIERLMRVQAL